MVKKQISVDTYKREKGGKMETVSGHTKIINVKTEMSKEQIEKIVEGKTKELIEDITDETEELIEDITDEPEELIEYITDEMEPTEESLLKEDEDITDETETTEESLLEGPEEWDPLAR